MTDSVDEQSFRLDPDTWKKATDEDLPFLDRYVAYASTMTNAPKKFHELMGLYLLSATVGRSIFFDTSAKRIYANLWVMMLGRSRLSKKTTALWLAENILPKSVVRMSEDCSPASMIWELNNATRRYLRAESTLLRDEFGGILKACAQQDFMSNFAETLCYFYDCSPRYKKSRKVERTVEVLKDIYLTIATGTTPASFLFSANAQMIHAGFFPRWLFVVDPPYNSWRARRPKTDADWDTEKELRQMLKELRKKLHFYREFNPIYDEEENDDEDGRPRARWIKYRDADGNVVTRFSDPSKDEERADDPLGPPHDEPEPQDDGVLRVLTPREVRSIWTDEAKARFDEWERSLDNAILEGKVSDLMSPFYGAITDHCLKFAMLLAIQDISPLAPPPDRFTVEIDDVDHAINLGEFYLEEYKKLAEMVIEQQMKTRVTDKAQRVEEEIQVSGKISRSALLRKLHRVLYASELDRILYSLKEAGIVEMGMEGRTEVWTWKGKPEEEPKTEKQPSGER